MAQLISELRDGLIITKRNIMRYIRLPQLIVISSIQPIMFLTLFNFVFGGALGAAAGVDYINFLLPGIMGGITNRHWLIERFERRDN